MIGRLSLLSLGVATAFASVSGASVVPIYDSNGFEPPRFHVGPLVGQDVGPAGPAGWVQSGVGGISAVVPDPSNPLNQVVQVSRVSGDTFYFPQANIPTLQRYVLVSYDLNVPAGAQGGNFGPFFGVQAYDAATNPAVPKVLGTGGVDAHTGEVLYEDVNGFQTTTNDATVNFGATNHFLMALDYQNQNYSLYLNGAPVATNVGFVDGPSTKFTDADLAGLAAQNEPPVETGTAYFDNYSVVTSDQVPEPASLGCLVLTGAAVLRRRRRAC
jgi:hypothetical protein